MKNLTEFKQIISIIKPKLEQNYFIKSIGVFGSFTRKEETSKSDLDILVDFSRPIDLFMFLELEEELEKVCGIKVDLVSKTSLKPNIGKQILNEVQYI